MYCESLSKGLHLRRYICDTGTSLTLVFNMKPAKTPLPAKKQIILGRLYNSISRRVCTGEKKRLKYRKKIEEILQAEDTTVTALQKIHGYLNYAAGVSPFGRPFLAVLTTAIQGRKVREQVPVTKEMMSSLRIWDNILRVNEGVSFDFILGKLPRSRNDIFVDASKE